MPRNDPTDTGGLFIGRRPGTAPLRYKAAPNRAGEGRRRPDALLAAAVLVLEALVCLTLDISCWWLARVDVFFARMIFYLGPATAFCLGVQLFGTLVDLVIQRRSRRMTPAEQIRKGAGRPGQPGSF